MRWHKDERKDDGNTLGHPAGGLAWKVFNKEHEWFAYDSATCDLVWQVMVYLVI